MPPRPIPPEDIFAFPDLASFSAFLAKEHQRRTFVWLRFFKKASGIVSISKDDAIDEALCWGWIDGQLGKGDGTSWLVRFSPRKPGSKWSQINTERIDRLIFAGRMQKPGLVEVDAAKTDGRWADAYAGQKSAETPDDLMAAITANPAALTTFETLNKQNRYALFYRVTSVKKPETRAKRVAGFVEMLARGETLYPQGRAK